jgi:hypothetical protein
MRAGLVAGGCPLVNTAVESDDGNAVLRAWARKALRSWTERLAKITVQGIEKNEIDVRVDPKKLSRLIIGSLEGALLVSRLDKDEEHLRDIRQHWTITSIETSARGIPLCLTHKNAGVEERGPVRKPKLDLDAPERRVRFCQRDADIPRFMAAPDHFALRAPASVGKHQADLAPKRQIGAYYSHATGMTDVDRNAICAAPATPVFPFDQKTEAGYGTFVGAHSRPAFFELTGQR